MRYRKGRRLLAAMAAGCHWVDPQLQVGGAAGCYSVVPRQQVEGVAVGWS